MKRTPPGGPRIAVAFDEPDEPNESVSWLRRIAMRLRAMFRPARLAPRAQSR